MLFGFLDSVLGSARRGRHLNILAFFALRKFLSIRSFSFSAWHVCTWISQPDLLLCRCGTRAHGSWQSARASSCDWTPEDHFPAICTAHFQLCSQHSFLDESHVHLQMAVQSMEWVTIMCYYKEIFVSMLGSKRGCGEILARGKGLLLKRTTLERILMKDLDFPLVGFVESRRKIMN